MARSARADPTRSHLVAAKPFEHALQNVEIASVVDDEAPSPGVDSRSAPQRLRECRLEPPDIGIGIEGQFVGLMPQGPPCAARRSSGR